MKRRSTQPGSDTTASRRHGRQTTVLGLFISALGWLRAAPPEVCMALGRAKASHTQTVSGRVLHLPQGPIAF